MATILGTDGDTTGALVTNITTNDELTAMVNPATHSLDGALLSADKQWIDDTRTLLAAQTHANGHLVESFASAVVDLKTMASNAITMPTAAGKKFYYLAERLEVVSRAANLTGDLKFVVAQNGTAISDEVDVDKADINSAAGLGLPCTVHIDHHEVESAAMDTNVLQFKITQGAASTGAVTGRLIIYGYYA